MRIPPSSFLRLQNAFRRGELLTILAGGDSVARQLSADPDPAVVVYTAETSMMIGAAHVAFERLDVARAYLDYGLSLPTEPDPTATDLYRSARARLGRRTPGGARPAAPPPAFLPTPPAAGGAVVGPYDPAAGYGPAPGYGAPAGPGRAGGPGGSAPYLMAPPAAKRSARSHGGTSLRDWAALTSIEIATQTGRYDEALAALTPLLEPTRAVTTRFSATRAQALITSVRGDDEAAHYLLNTAAGLANRVPSQFRSALVEADRAMVLAGQGRLHEAVTIADRVLAQLVRPVSGEYQLWAATEAASVALTLSRRAARDGDLLTAQRLLRVGEGAARSVGRHQLEGQVALTRGVGLGAEHHYDAAEQSILVALGIFHTYGYRPAAAQCIFEQGRLAHERGLVRSAGPLYERALAEHSELGLPREMRQLRRLLDALASNLSPADADQAAAAARFPTVGPRR